MKVSPSDPVLVIVDGPDPDNFACVLAATSAFFNLNVVAVIMTGRPVNASHAAPNYANNPHASRAVRRDNALHVKGILVRHGREHIPVFQGLRAPFTTVPHKFHIHERVTDIYDDAHAGHTLAGDIDDAVAFLSNVPGPIHIICGGPLTDLAYLMRQPELFAKLGIVTTQLGMFGTAGVKTIAGGRRQFNVLADPGAVHDVLTDYWNPIFLVPTDVTKHPEHAFADPDELAPFMKSSAAQELLEMYRAAWPIMWGPRGEQIYVHDFHAAELMMALLHQAASYAGQPEEERLVWRYQLSSVGIAHVPYLPPEMERWGEIDLGDAINGGPRLLATGAHTHLHRRVLPAALNSPARPVEANPIQAARA